MDYNIGAFSFSKNLKKIECQGKFTGKIHISTSEVICNNIEQKYKTYDEDNINWVYARDRDTSKDGDICLWAAIFAQFLGSIERSDSIEIDAFCYHLGIDIDRHMKFMSLEGTIKKCHEWIKLSGFGDSIDRNIEKARQLAVGPFLKYLSTVTQLYIDHLIIASDPNRNIPEGSFEIDYGPLPPAKYCKLFGFKDTPLKYFIDRTNE